MALSVERMARIGAAVMSGRSSVDKFIETARLDETDAAEAREVWADVEEAQANLKPGESLALPGEWS